MNGTSAPKEYRYRDQHWEDEVSSRAPPPPPNFFNSKRRETKNKSSAGKSPPSSAYDQGHMSPYRGNSRGHPIAPPSNGYSSDQGSVASSEDGPTYILEHLATFRVSPESGLVYPADGMRRLLHMEKTTGIWTQKMLLKLERKWVFILSHENGDVVEKFPMELIREPTAFTSDDPKELYNNIFIFVVAEDPKRKYDNPTEMHIFQCLRISAKDVVEDIKIFMTGKGLNGAIRTANSAPVRRSEPHIPPTPQHEVPADTSILPNGYRDFADAEGRGEVRGSRSERSSVSHNDEVSSTSSERYERNVAILNNSFDDIERFIARLQHTAAATKELERRRRSRKSKKKDIGDGLLSMRAKPPPEREFVDIFQKFKLCFNLLAKLRDHIRDPNAPELVHFLFTPLTLIVDASRDSYFEPSLPSKVESPLLTQDAIDLLTNCLTSRETELWHSLGDAWLIPRESWKYPVPPYRPVFYSGWAPEIADEEKRDSRRYSQHIYPDRGEGRGIREDYEFYDSDRRETSPPPPSDIPARYRSPPKEERPRSMTPLSEYQDGMDPHMIEMDQRKWLEELKSRYAKIVQVTYPRTANNDKELTVVRGEYLEVLDDSRKWWKARNSRGITAHVPHTIVTPYVPEDQSPPRGAPMPGRQAKKGGTADNEKTGILSEHYNTFGDSSDDETITNSSIPPPPPIGNIPLAPPPPTKDPHPVRPTATANVFPSRTTRNRTDLINEELKLVLHEFRSARPHLDIVKTPDVFISQSSTPEDVQYWLKLKGFNERIQKQFDGVNGEKMFSLSKKKLEEYCGKSEGGRLASQITIQRNISGYKTARSAELKQILAQQKRKIEESNSSIEKHDNKPKVVEAPRPQVYLSQKEPVLVQSMLHPSELDRSLSPKPESVQQQRSRSKSEQKKIDIDNVSANFSFLHNFDDKGYDSSEEFATDGENEKKKNKNTKVQSNTLKDQIKRQHQKIVKAPNEVITSH